MTQNSPPTNAQLAAQIAAQQSQINSLTSDVSTLKTTVAGLVAAEPPVPGVRVPAAVTGTGMMRLANWDFGASGNVKSPGDLLGSGWAQDAGTWGVETAAVMATGSDPHFQVQSDHVDLVNVWNGNATPKQGDGSITAPVLVCHVDHWGMSGPGYYEGTFRIPNLMGMWPAWWMIGWDMSLQSATWGPEIDVFEFWSDSDKGPGRQFSTLHAPADPSLCFLPAPGTVEWQTGVPTISAAKGASGTGWAAGGIEYAPGIDFSQDFHTFGVRINEDFSIDLFTDDVLVGSYAAKQFCTDAGKPVVPRPIIDFAVQSNFNPADFGGANNSGPTNKWRLGIRNIQFWG